MTTQNSQTYQCSPHDLGPELCRYRSGPFGNMLPKSFVGRWLVVLFYYLFTVCAIALGAGYMVMPLMLLAGPVQRPVTADPFWGPIFIACYAACFSLLAFVCFGWPRLMYLAIHEKGFVYRGMCHRYTVCFDDIARCFVRECYPPLVTLVLRDSTRLRLQYLKLRFPQEGVGQLLARINEHLAARGPHAALAVQTQTAMESSSPSGESGAAQSKPMEMAIPRTLWERDRLGFAIFLMILLSPAMFAAFCLIVFDMETYGKVHCWLLLLLFGGLPIWGVCWSIWDRYKRDGGSKEFYRDVLGLIARKHFLESLPQDDGSVEIRYGFQLRGHRYFYFKVPLEKIESVRWHRGQAPRDWTVFIQSDHFGSSHFGLYQIGPTRGVKKTDALGLAIIDFLGRAGARFVEGEDEGTFLRASSATTPDSAPEQ